MNSPGKVCPPCQFVFTNATEAGRFTCPARGCEFVSDEKGGHLTSRILEFKGSFLRFLMMLVAPIGALLTMAGMVRIGLSNDAAPFLIGQPTLLFSFGSAGYCSWWLAKRISSRAIGRGFLTVVFLLLLLVVNLFTVLGGWTYIIDRL